MQKIALIGCGRIADKHIQAIANNSYKVQLVAVCDVILERAQVCKRRFLMSCCSFSQGENGEKCEIKVYTNYERMLDEVSIDLVAVATESGYHAQIAITCMEMGKHVIVEKPMALSIADADMMIRVARANNVKLCVAHQNRFNPAVRKLRKAVKEGRFGKLIAGNARILWNRNEDYYKQASWRGTYEQDGGCLMNQCIHNIDLLQWMMGSEIEWVNGEVSNILHPYIEAEDYGSIQIKFNNGAIGNVEGTVCTYPENLEETLTILGEKGTVSIGGLAVNKIETWRFADGLDDEQDVVGQCEGDVDSIYGNGHISLYEDMIAAIECEREPCVNGEAGQIALGIILATYQSSKEKRRISYPLGQIECISFRK